MKRQRYYICVCRDAFDGAVCLKIQGSRHMEAVLVFLGECWKTVGRPDRIRFNNARSTIEKGQRSDTLNRLRISAILN